MYIFPGLGLGALLSRARHVPDGMVEAAARALADALTAEEQEAGLIYPRLERIRQISTEIAAAVVRAAQKGVSQFLLALWDVETGADGLAV